MCVDLASDPARRDRRQNFLVFGYATTVDSSRREDINDLFQTSHAFFLPDPPGIDLQQVFIERAGESHFLSSLLPASFDPAVRLGA